VSPNYLPCDVQAETAAGNFFASARPPVELLEDPLPIALGYPRALIDDLNHHSLGVRIGTKDYRRGRRRVLQGIVNDLPEREGHHFGIGEHARHSKQAVDAGYPLVASAVEARDCRAYQRIDIDGGPLHLRLYGVYLPHLHSLGDEPALCVFLHIL